MDTRLAVCHRDKKRVKLIWPFSQVRIVDKILNLFPTSHNILIMGDSSD
jgi:hypothetical protein